MSHLNLPKRIHQRPKEEPKFNYTVKGSFNAGFGQNEVDKSIYKEMGKFYRRMWYEPFIPKSLR